MVKPWSFDQDVAKDFENHAIQHIPNYLEVIGKTIEICNFLLPKDAAIIDVGCAIGHTLKALNQNGFTNLYGVDSSQSMLDKCPGDIAQLANQETLPTQWGQYDAIICNWTLHFVKDKQKYLSDIYDALDDDGFLILSEKVSLDPLLISLYHNYKLRKGVSQEEIQIKQQRLVGNMHINDVQWYIETLSQVGFSKIDIIDASWCFTTFLVRK